MRNGCVLLTVALLLVVVSVAGAQEGSAEFPSLAAAEVLISNSSSNRTLYFRISGDACAPPLDAHLKPDHYGTFSCQGAKAFRFSIQTTMNNGSVVSRTATLQPTRRYELFAESSGVWAIREIQSR